MNKKVTLIIQARVNSSRLPNKVLADLFGRPMICFQIERIKRCKKIDEIYLATTKNPEDNILENLSKELKINLFRGSENDVLERFIGISKISNSDIFIRITGDCPFSDPDLIDEAVSLFLEKKS